MERSAHRFKVWRLVHQKDVLTNETSSVQINDYGSGVDGIDCGGWRREGADSDDGGLRQEWRRQVAMVRPAWLVWVATVVKAAIIITTAVDDNRSRESSKLVSIGNNRNWIRLNRNKQMINQNSLIWSIFWYFFRKFKIFPFFLVCFGFDVSIQTKQTEDQPKQFDREHILVFLWKFRVVSVSFGLFRNSSVCFDCFDIGSQHWNKPKQTETNQNFLCFWFH
jgi:hypothetical protein